MRKIKEELILKLIKFLIEYIKSPRTIYAAGLCIKMFELLTKTELITKVSYELRISFTDKITYY